MRRLQPPLGRGPKPGFRGPGSIATPRTYRGTLLGSEAGKVSGVTVLATTATTCLAPPTLPTASTSLHARSAIRRPAQSITGTCACITRRIDNLAGRGQHVRGALSQSGHPQPAPKTAATRRGKRAPGEVPRRRRKLFLLSCKRPRAQTNLWLPVEHVLIATLPAKHDADCRAVVAQHHLFQPLASCPLDLLWRSLNLGLRYFAG